MFFSRFEEKESVSSIQQLKSSVQKGIRAKLLEAYPHLESHMDVIVPKKDSYRIAKWYVTHRNITQFVLFNNPLVMITSKSY